MVFFLHQNITSFQFLVFVSQLQRQFQDLVVRNFQDKTKILRRPLTSPAKTAAKMAKSALKYRPKMATRAQLGGEL